MAPFLEKSLNWLRIVSRYSDNLTNLIANEYVTYILNPLNTLLFFNSFKILNKFKNLFLTLNEDRALRQMIQNVLLSSFESIFYALSKTFRQVLVKIILGNPWEPLEVLYLIYLNVYKFLFN